MAVLALSLQESARVKEGGREKVVASGERGARCRKEDIGNYLEER